MSRVYSKFCFLVALLFVALAVSACTPGGYGVNTGIVTKDPNSIPNIAWQTDRQRDVLIAQDETLQKEATIPDPNRPSLQTVVGGAPLMKTAKVSLLLPLSGKKSDLGQSMLKAAQMALFDVGSTNFELIPRDTQSTPEGAEAAARAAIAAGSALILGPVFADDLKRVKPLAVAANIPVVGFTTDWTLAGNNTYIMGFLPFTQVARVTRFAASRGVARFAVYAPQTEYSDVVIDTLRSAPVSIVRTNRYAPDQPDLSTLVKDFADTSRRDVGFEFNALMLPLGGEGLQTLTSLLDFNGVTQKDVRFIGTGLWDDPALLQNPALYGGWFAAPDPALRRDFDKRYQENFGAAPLRLSSLAYDATALAAVLARTVTDGAPYSTRHMTNPRGFAGIDGIFRFRGDGLSERGLAILEIQAGRTKVIDPAPTAFLSSGS